MLSGYTEVTVHPHSVERSPSGKHSREKAATPKRKQSERIREIWPDLREMILPRRKLLALGLGLMIINRLSGLVLPYSTRFLIDNVVGKHQIALLTPLVLTVLGATVIQGITSFTLTQLLSKAGQRLIAELRQKVQQHIGRLSVGYYDANKSGVLVSRIMTDVEGVRNLIGTGLVEFVGGLMTAVVALVVLLRISAIMTGLTALFVALLRVRAIESVHQNPAHFPRARQDQRRGHRPPDRIAGRRARGQGLSRRRARGRGVRGRRQTAADERGSLAHRHVLHEPLGHRADGHRGRGGDVRRHAADLRGHAYAGRVRHLHRVPGVPGGAGVRSGGHRHPDHRGAGRPRPHPRSPEGERPEDEDPNRTVALGPDQRRSDFRKRRLLLTKPASRCCSMSASAREPGTVTALVGPSGSGKSTIISLIAAFHVPTEGKVFVDGVDLSTVRLDSYRTQLGVVLQDTFLFDGSIEENIAFARPNATKEQILEACRIARVDEFAENFEKKYDTVVGERGVKLSGGQRQRVSIARAILADPRILILDEATSSLDSESEALIQEGLKYLMKGRTTFVIAHRLSTIRRADQILVVEAGRIVERGTHESLYALGGRYWDLYTRQHGLEANLFLAPGEGDSIPESEKAAGRSPTAPASAKPCA